MQVWSLGQEDLLKEGVAVHSSILAWRIPWTEEPGEPQSMGWQRVGYDWGDLACRHLKQDLKLPSHRPRPWSQVPCLSTRRQTAVGDSPWHRVIRSCSHPSAPHVHLAVLATWSLVYLFPRRQHLVHNNPIIFLSPFLSFGRRTSLLPRGSLYRVWLQVCERPPSRSRPNHGMCTWWSCLCTLLHLCCSQFW